MFKSYTDVRDWLEKFIPQTYTKKNLGLARIEYLLKLLGNPQNKFKSIHVAGTSGKGSTAFYIARLLQLSDRRLKVGLHISPHLVDIRERMQILSSSVIPANAGIKKSSENWIPNQVGNDNTLMPMGRFLRLFNEVGSIVEKIKKEKPNLTPSYFEILVAVSFLYFAQEKVDIAVVEVGLGGRLDATNVLTPEVSVITNIGLDHTDILGKTIEEIAREKAGIIKEAKVTKVTKEPKEPEVNARVKFEQGVIPIVTGASGRALEVIKSIAKKRKAPLITLNTQMGVQSIQSDIKSYLTLYNDILKSTHVFLTKDVFLLTLATASTLKIPVNKAKIIEAFSVSFPARFEEIAPNVVIDGAHNLEKMKALVHFLKNQKPETRNQKLILVCAFKKGKDWKKMLEYLFRNLDIERCYATQFYSVTDTGFFAAVEPEEIKSYIESKRQKAKVEAFENSQEAMFEAIIERDKGDKRAKGAKGLILVTGSLYLAGEARSIWF